MAETNLETLAGMDPEKIELLQSVGVEGVKALAMCDPQELLDEMEMANRHLQLVQTLPSLAEVTQWVDGARSVGLELPDDEEFSSPAPEAGKGPTKVFHAVPVKKEMIVEHKISVSEVPVMEQFYAPGELSTETEESREAAPAGKVPVREIRSKPKAKSVMGGNLVKTEIKRKEVSPLKRSPGIDIRKTASPELNAGKKSHTRSYIRGVLHPQPGRVKFGAFFSLLTLILMPLTFVTGVLMITVYKGRVPENPWLLAVPAAFLLMSIFYVLQARGVKCRVCGQPLFSPKACRRNPKAHHVPLLGYILPTSLHMLIFHWFRCIYCGTSIRLKK